MRWVTATATVAAVACMILAGCAGSEEEERKPFKVGVAALKITPHKTGLYLAGWGHNRAFTKVHDDIWVRAIAFSRGDTTVVWVNLDLLGLLEPDVTEIRERVGDLPPDHIVITCTHVHSAPDVIGLWGPKEDVPGVDKQFRQFVKDRTVEAIKRALRSMKTARIKLAKTQAPPKTAINHIDPNLIDREITILEAVNPADEPIATVVNWACHPECLDKKNLELTSDYVHWLRQVIETKVGGTCLFFNGALGGMVSPDCKEHSFAEAQRIGTAVGEAVVAALEEAEGPLRPEIAFASKTVTIPIESPRLLAALKAGLLVPYRGLKKPEAKADIAVMWLGPSVWMTMPGEPLPAVGLKAKGMVRADYKFFVSLANNELGYIIPPDVWGQKKYDYVMSMSAGRKTADICLKAISELLAQAPDWAKPKKAERQSEQGSERQPSESKEASAKPPATETSNSTSTSERPQAAVVPSKSAAPPAPPFAGNESAPASAGPPPRPSRR